VRLPFRKTAQALNTLGIELKDAGRLAEAEQAYLRAIQRAPEWYIPWYNLGLVYKVQRRWADSARCNLRAAELAPDDGDVWWNLGIAATALRDWALARRAWRGCGLELPDGDGPPHADYGPVPIRINPETSGEVLWCDRIDPARAIIRNVPLPGSGHAEGDTVLHDGQPNGYRMLAGRQLPVFDALEVLERSGRVTVEAWVEAPGPEDVEALEALAEARGIALEDWTRTIRRICRQCSEGVPHETHAYVEDEAEWAPARHLGTAPAAASDVRRLLEDWVRDGFGRRLVGVGIPDSLEPPEQS